MADVQLPAGYTLDTAPSVQLPQGYSLDSGRQTEQTAKPGFFEEYWNKINPLTMVKGAAQMAAHPIEAAKAYGEQTSAIGQRAIDSFKQGDYTGAAAHTLHYFLNGIPGLGASLDEAGTKLANGDYAGGTADTAALATMIAGPKILSGAAKIPGAVAEAAKTPGVAQMTRGGLQVAGAAGAASRMTPEGLLAGTYLGERGITNISEGLTAFRAARSAAIKAGASEADATLEGLAQVGPHPLEVPRNPLEVTRPPQPLSPTGPAVITYGPVLPSEAPAPIPKDLLDGITKDLTEGKIKTFEKAPENVQTIVRQAATRIGTNAPSEIAPAPALPETAAAPPVVPPGAPLEPPPAATQQAPVTPPAEAPAVSSGDWAAQLQKQIDQKIAAQKEVEAAIPSEAGENIPPQQQAARQQVADKGAKYLASQGLTPGRVEALRQTNPEMYQSLRDEVGSAKGVSKQKNYSPSDDTWDLMLERLSLLEGQGKIPGVQPRPQLPVVPVSGPLATNPRALAAAQRLAEELQANQ